MRKESLLKSHVGIDVSKEKFDVALGSITTDQDVTIIARHQFVNNAQGFEDFLEWVEDKRDRSIPVGFSMEATGVYYERLAYYLSEIGQYVHVLVPSRARKFADSLGIKTKTDKLDAQNLARLGLERKLETWTPPSPVFGQLRNLIREREQLVGERTQVLNQRHANSYSQLKNDNTSLRIQRHLDLINQFIDEIEKDIAELIESQPDLFRRINKLVTIPGVGQITAVTVLAETNGFNLIRNQRQLVSYAGYDVKISESGQYKGKGKISKMGNRHIRRALHCPAVSATRFNPMMKDFYEKIVKRREIKMVGCVAVQRKLLCLLYTLWKNDENFSMDKAKSQKDTSRKNAKENKNKRGKKNVVRQNRTTLDRSQEENLLMNLLSHKQS